MTPMTTTTTSKFVKIGAFLAFLAVGMGAFGAHALKNIIREDIFKTAVQYHIVHALAILVVVLLSEVLPEKKLFYNACRLFVAGIVLFSGSLYILAITHVGFWGAITPLGGICFLAGWALTFLGAAKRV